MVLIYFRTAALIVIKAEKDLIKFKGILKCAIVHRVDRNLKFLEYIVDRNLKRGNA